MARLVFRRPDRAAVSWLILTHRYLGATLGVAFAAWFASGVAMIYVRGMPAVSSTDRLQRLAPLAIDRVALTPEEAASRSAAPASPDHVRLFMIGDRPVYRIPAAQPVTVFADSGELVPPVNVEAARHIAAAFVSHSPDSFVFQGRVTAADQWTLGQRRQMPLLKFGVRDQAATELYVSETLGEVVMMTTRRSRLLAWLGPIPHWIYFAALRRNDEVWRQVVLWVSAAGFLLAALGLIVGLRQWRARYVGWLKWHQAAGLVFGVFALTWVFSGWLSMEPGAWASADRTLGATIAGELNGFPPPSPPAHRASTCVSSVSQQVKEIEWTRILGARFCDVRTAGESWLVDASSGVVRREAFERDALVAAVERAVAGAKIVRAEQVSRRDSYYYSRDAHLPVLRIVLDDAAQSWVYVDPQSARLVAVVNRRDRLERWLYHGLHSLDFAFWYQRRPLWDAAVVTLSTGGFALSLLGLMLAGRRVGRFVRRGSEQR